MPQTWTINKTSWDYESLEPWQLGHMHILLKDYLLRSSNKTIISSSLVPPLIAYCNAVLPSRSMACELAPLHRNGVKKTKVRHVYIWSFAARRLIPNDLHRKGERADKWRCSHITYYNGKCGLHSGIWILKILFFSLSRYSLHNRHIKD